jgi:hypothetical protein
MNVRHDAPRTERERQRLCSVLTGMCGNAHTGLPHLLQYTATVCTGFQIGDCNY